MVNQTINKYIISINDRKMRLILQTMMKEVYSIEDKVIEAVDEFNNPINDNDVDTILDSKIAAKLMELNVFINSKFQPIISEVAKIKNAGGNDIEERISGLEKFIDSVGADGRVDALLARVEELENNSNCKGETKPKAKEKAKKKVVKKKATGFKLKAK